MNKTIDSQKNMESGSVIHGMGTGLLLVAFITVCLVTFAVLSYVTAKNDYKASENLANMQLAYYEACNEAEEAEWIIDEARNNGYLPRQITLSGGKVITPTYTDEGFSFQIPIDEKRTFEAAMQYDGEGGYRVVEWHVVQ